MEESRLTEALKTIVDVLVRPELDTVRESLERIEARTTEAVEEIKSDSISRINELRSRLLEVEESRKADLDEIRRQLQETGDRHGESIAAVRGDLSQKISEVQAELGKEMEAVRGGLSNAQIELRQQLDSAAALSGVLDDMAIALSQRTGRPLSAASGETEETAAAPEPAPAPNPAAGPAPEPSVENVVDQVLGLDGEPAPGEASQP